MRHAARWLALVVGFGTLSIACASTPSSGLALQPFDRDGKSHEKIGGPVEKKAPSSGVESSSESSEPEPSTPLEGSPDVSYEEAMNAAESEISDEGIAITECNVVGGSLAMSCDLDGAATAKFVVQGGVVKGVTVETTPKQPRVAKCMRSAIAGVTFRAAKAPTGCTRTFKMSK